MNNVILKGKVLKKPNYSPGNNNNHVCSFSLITTELVNDKEISEKHDIVAFGKLALAINKLIQENMQVVVIGNIKSRKHQPKGKDFTVKKVEVIASNISVDIQYLLNKAK